MLKRGDCQLYNTKSTLGQVVSFEEQTQSSNTEWKQLKIDYFSKTCGSFESISVVSLPRFFRKRLSKTYPHKIYYKIMQGQEITYQPKTIFKMVCTLSLVDRYAYR